MTCRTFRTPGKCVPGQGNRVKTVRQTVASLKLFRPMEGMGDTMTERTAAPGALAEAVSFLGLFQRPA